MFCAKCGKELPDNAKFCNACGTKVEVPTQEEPAGNPEPQGTNVTKNIVLGKDGKYHWYYEFKLMKNPTILWLLMKMFFWIVVGILLFVLVLDVFDNGWNWEYIKDVGSTFILVLCIMEVLVMLGYFVYALMQGWKYCVLFDMDESGVTHTQMPKQFKKAQAASLLLIFMGAAAGKPGAVGTGMLSAAKSRMFSPWSSVRSVEFHRKRDVIKVNERLNRNQVYALKEDYPFVEEYIRAHVTPKCKFREY